jgi:hypothetical protein
MAKFAWVWKEIGVAGDPWRYAQTIPVPFRDANLLMLRDARGAHAKFDARHVDVDEVNSQFVASQFESYLDGIEVGGGARKDLLDTLVPTVQHEALSGFSKIFSVKGKIVGRTTLQAGRVTQAIEVIPAWTIYTVSFRFLRRPGTGTGQGSGTSQKVAGTRRGPAEVDEWISKLNWIFGSQANITFQVGTSEWVEADRPLGPVNLKIAQEHLESKKDDAADVTVFLVGEVAPPDSGFTYRPADGGSWAVCVEDDPNEPGVQSDSFLLVLAHELSHFVMRDTQNIHFCEDGILRSHGIQTTKIGDLLRPLLIKPGTLPPRGTVCN